MKTNVKIHLKDGEIEMQCAYIAMNDSIINVKESLSKESKVFLFDCKHSYLQTQFNLTNTNSLWLITFDEKKEFVTVIPHFHRTNAPYSIVIREPYVLILDGDIKLKFEDITRIELN